MYTGKHMRRARHLRRKRGIRKSTVLLAALGMLLVLAVGTTAAFLIASDGPIINIFKSSKVTSAVHEASFDKTTKTDVTVQNTGDIEAYIRATFVVTWKDKEGNVHGSVPVLNSDYTIELKVGEGENWFQGPGGYYYYKKPVASGSSTTALIESCTYLGNAPEGYGLNVEILGSAIQSVPNNVVQDKWGVEVNGKGDNRFLSNK